MRVFVFALCALSWLAGAPGAQAEPSITGAVLPTARSVAVGEPATFFVTMVNSGTTTAVNCGPNISDGILAQSVQLRDFPLDDQLQLAGDDNASISIPAGQSQNILLELTAPASFAGTIPLTMSCNNGRAGYSSSVHDVQLTAIDDGISADIIAVGLTATNDGIIQISEAGRAGIMSVAATNIARPGEENAPAAAIRVEPRAGRFSDEFDLTVCELDAGSVCITPRSAFLDIQFAPGENRFFGVFARSPAGSGIPLIPDLIRVELAFSDTPSDGDQYLRARTSAAVTSPPPANVGSSPAGIYEFRVAGDGADPFYAPGWLYVDTDGSVIGSIATRQGNWQDNVLRFDAPIPDAGEDGRARILTGYSSSRTMLAGHGLDVRLVVEPQNRIFGTFGLEQASDLAGPQFVPHGVADFAGAPHSAHYAADTVLTLEDVAGSYTVIDERSGDTVGSMTVTGNTAQVQTTILGTGPFGTRGPDICQISLNLDPAEQGRMINIVGGSISQCPIFSPPPPLSGRAAWRPVGDGTQDGYHFVFYTTIGDPIPSPAYGFVAIPD